MERKLSPTERQYLINCHRMSSDKRTCDRIKAVLAYDEGYTYAAIAKILLLDDETIRRHIHDYFSQKKINPANGGSQSHLDDDQTAKLIAHLETMTYLYAKEICVYVLKTFGVTYTVSGMIKWLQKNNFRYKKPHGVPAKADLQKQEDFIAKYNELKSSIKSDEIILFGDSTHPQHQTKLAYGWIKKGVRKSEKMTACQKRINIIGAINLNTHAVEYSQVDWVNTDSLKAFLLQLCAAYPNASAIHLILDNAGYHKSEAFLKFVATTKVKIHYLPPYSPNLNPIERLWKIMHENTTYNRYYAKLSEFTDNIIGFFENIGKYKSIIQARINDNFQRLKLAPSS
jgi:Transposase and inactivated derivatives